MHQLEHMGAIFFQLTAAPAIRLATDKEEGTV